MLTISAEAETKLRRENICTYGNLCSALTSKEQEDPGGLLPVLISVKKYVSEQFDMHSNSAKVQLLLLSSFWFRTVSFHLGLALDGECN